MKRWICGIAGAVLILYALFLAAGSILGIIISIISFGGHWSVRILTREWMPIALSATTLCLGVILVKKARGPKATPNEGPFA